jgi:hypothetical protein
MLVDSQFCNKLRCRDSGFVQSPESQYYRDPVFLIGVDSGVCNL